MSAQCLIEISYQIVGAFQTHRYPDYPVAQADSRAAFGAHGPVGCGRWMCDKRFRVAQVVGDADELQLVQHLESALLGRSLGNVEFKGHDGTAARHLPLGKVVLWMRRQEWIPHPPHCRMAF